MEENVKLGTAISDLDRRIEEMHRQFIRFHHGETHRIPDLERLEHELLLFSRKSIPAVELAVKLDRLLHKFQNRKAIWRRWTEEAHHGL